MNPALHLQRTDDRFGRATYPEAHSQRIDEPIPYGDEKNCRDAFRASVGNVAIIDCAGKIIGANKAWLRFARQHGGRSSKVALGANYLKVCQTAMRLGERDASAALYGIIGVLDGSLPEFSLEYRCRTEPEETWFELMVHPLCRREGGAVITHLNVSGRHSSELQALGLAQELAHMNRLSALGELTATFAHGLSQPLAAINANIEALKNVLTRSPPESSPMNEVLSDLITDNQRAGKFMRNLLRLLEKGPLRFRSIEINPLIRNVAALLRGVAQARKVKVSLNLDSKLPPVWGEQVHLQQVVLNLTINAFEAMRHTKVQDREVTICTGVTDEDKALISVRDRGSGIPAGQLKNIFEPFFTTKPKGLGMGLTICRSIIEAHKGEISVENNSANGVTFRVILPSFKSKRI